MSLTLGLSKHYHLTKNSLNGRKNAPIFNKAGENMDLLQMIGQVGFPIAVAGWLLVRMEQKLDEAEKTARELCTKIETQITICMKCRKGDDEL